MNKFANNPCYVQYESLLRELHRFIAAGMGDSDEAEAVREEMDAPEQRLTQDEIMRLNGLSADLYMLQDDEIYEKYDGTQEELRASLKAALDRHNHEAVLSLLRKGTPFLTPGQVAALRGRSYAALGHLETALPFLQYAAQREPEDAAHGLFLVGLLLQLDRPEDALAETQEYARSAERTLALAV